MGSPHGPAGPSLTSSAHTFTCEVQHGVVLPSIVRHCRSINSLVLFGQLERRMSGGSVSMGSRRSHGRKISLGSRPAPNALCDLRQGLSPPWASVYPSGTGDLKAPSSSRAFGSKLRAWLGWRWTGLGGARAEPNACMWSRGSCGEQSTASPPCRACLSLAGLHPSCPAPWGLSLGGPLCASPEGSGFLLPPRTRGPFCLMIVNPK